MRVMTMYIDEKEKLLLFEQMLYGDHKYLLSAENLERYCKGNTAVADFAFKRLRAQLKKEFKFWKANRKTFTSYDEIEDYIGYKLPLLFTALNNGVWTIPFSAYESNDYYYRKARLGKDFKLYGVYDSMWKGEELKYQLKPEDYGKTWALTKTELIKNKETI